MSLVCTKVVYPWDVTSLVKTTRVKGGNLSARYCSTQSTYSFKGFNRNSYLDIHVCKSVINIHKHKCRYRQMFISVTKCESQVVIYFTLHGSVLQRGGSSEIGPGDSSLF